MKECWWTEGKPDWNVQNGTSIHKDEIVADLMTGYGREQFVYKVSQSQRTVATQLLGKSTTVGKFRL
jgi:hypothetical protein